MTNMHHGNTPLARMRALLAATIMLGVLLFVVTTTQATGEKQSAHRAGSRVVPATPAGPRGPITLACGQNGVDVIASGGPAGPQGPVGVSCAPSPNG